MKKTVLGQSANLREDRKRVLGLALPKSLEAPHRLPDAFEKTL
jgi:hypothetical protein